MLELNICLQSAPADLAASGHPGAISIAGRRRQEVRPE